MSSKTRKLVLFSVLLSLCLGLAVPTLADDEPEHLLGTCDRAALSEEPFAEWFHAGYEGYTPNPEVLERLRALDSDDVELTVFFGTWCGDSRREVPHLLKLADSLGLGEGAVNLVALDRAEGAHKRSPGGEEVGREIYRVPTIVVERGGQEVARLVEYPALSLERDLSTILAGEPYRASYASYPTVRRWLADGLLADDNVSPDGLADQVRNLISSEWELVAPARVLFDRGQTAEGLKLYLVNRALHWQSADAHARLAKALHTLGDLEAARTSAERALRRSNDPDTTDAMLDLLAELGNDGSGA